MTDIILELQTIEWSNLVAWLAIIIVALPKAVGFVNKFEKDMDFRFPWTNYKMRVNEKFDELDNKINTTRKELDEKIDSIHNEEHKEHEVWHQQSITIRDNLKENQHRLEENQSAFMQTLAEISKSLAELKADFLDERLERKRWNIINCSSKLRNGEYVDLEEFNNVFDDYDSYEAIIDKHGLKNGKVEESIKFIREKYQELLCKEK